MKISLRHITLCTAVTASIVTGCAVKGKTADTDVQDTAAQVAENAPEAEKAEAGITEADEDNGLYTARINADGGVQLAFDMKKCTDFARQNGGDFRLGQTAKVENIPGKCIEIKAVNLGNSEDPYLILRTEKNGVALLSITDALLTGDMECSGTLPETEGAQFIEVQKDKYGVRAFAVISGDLWIDINPSTSVAGYYKIDGMEITLTRDWGVHIQDVNIDYIRHGTFAHYFPEDDSWPEAERLVFRFAEEEVKVQMFGEGGNRKMVFRAGRNFPLVTGEPLDVQYGRSPFMAQ
ncbi:MAG: hypothetical protein SO064_00960 [Prevotella sp.]|nr:hypothetical protein [Prevotella sp.]